MVAVAKSFLTALITASGNLSKEISLNSSFIVIVISALGVMLLHNAKVDMPQVKIATDKINFFMILNFKY
ncbi:hypothetical protein GCM10022397_13100 [Flavivirga jejuensis]